MNRGKNKMPKRTSYKDVYPRTYYTLKNDERLSCKNRHVFRTKDVVYRHGFHGALFCPVCDEVVK